MLSRLFKRPAKATAARLPTSAFASNSTPSALRQPRAGPAEPRKPAVPLPNPGASKEHLEARLRELRPEDLRYFLLKATLDYLDGHQDRAISEFRDFVRVATREILSDRDLLREVGDASFRMRELAAFEALLLFQHHVPIRLVFDRTEEKDESWLVAWSLDRDGGSTFRFSEVLHDHPWGAELVNRLVQALPLLSHVARDPDAVAGQLWFNNSDWGVRPGLAYCDCRRGYRLIPDSYFLQSRGYACVKGTYARQAVPWAERLPVAFWRGTPHGLWDYARRPIRSWRDLPRVQLCRLVQSEAAQGLFDVALSSVDQVRDEAGRQAIRAAGLLKDWVRWPEFQRYRYQIDIDGFSNSWPGLFTKLCTGSPVLKVQSPWGFRQWYYGRLVAWRHFVPVAADMSDLIEKVAWLRAHDDEARRIGDNARRLAFSMSESAEIVGAAPTIRRALAAS